MVKPTYNFSTVEDIRAIFRVQNHPALAEALVALRNQLTVKHWEPPISPQDDRLLLAQRWLESAPGARDIFELWEGINQKQTSVLSVLVSLLACLLTLLSSHYSYHVLGQSIIKSLLTSPWIRRLNACLVGSHNELILVTLKLFNRLSVYAGGREQKTVLEAFAWETKSLPKLLNMRRKTKSGEITDPLIRPDIRTSYIHYILSFVSPESSTLVKTFFLDHHRDVFLSIFKGLAEDSFPVVRKVLQVCWDGIWCDPKIKRTVKIGLFNETTLSQIIKVYERVASEDAGREQVPADLVHHFLLAICTRPGTGICFRDRGWYMRDPNGDTPTVDNEKEETAHQGGKIYNKILANILKNLRVNEDSRQQELALKVMIACPELVAGYWRGVALTFEPRLSSKWIANISFFGSVISLPVPSSSFLLPNSDLHQSSPPPLSNVLENIFPSVNTKTHFSKGLQSTSPLVQHCTALALAKCLIKYQDVLRIFRTVKAALEEDDDHGQWCKRWREVEREVRRRVPDFQVVVAFSQGRSVSGPNQTKTALLAESAQRLLWMYHRCLPSLVAEARFDVGKLLQNFMEPMHEDGMSDGLQAVWKLHVLRLLKESNQFTWSKTVSSAHSHLYVLLKANIVAEAPAIRATLTALLGHILSRSSILFEDDPDEPYLWLASIPVRTRSSGIEAPDGASLTDEGDSVIAFLDDCIQRCLKTPYRYLEDMYAVCQSNTEPDEHRGKDRLDIYPSPLLMTVSEQLVAKLANKLLTASDVLAIVTFVRKLVVRLSTKLPDLQFLDAFARRMDLLIQPEHLFPQYPIMSSAIRRELSILHSSLQYIQSPGIYEPAPSSHVVQDFLNQVEQLSVPESVTARVNFAFELVDWLRLINHPLHSNDIKRLMDAVERLHKPALREVAEHLDPGRPLLWGSLNIVSRWPEHRVELSFEWLFIQSSEVEISTHICRNILLESLYTDSVTLVDIKRATCLIIHRLLAVKDNDSLAGNLLLLLGLLTHRAPSVLSLVDAASLKEYIFLQSDTIKELCLSQSLGGFLQEGLTQFVNISLDVSTALDRRLAADISHIWLNILKGSLRHPDPPTVAAIPWIKYLEIGDLFDLLDVAGNAATANPPALNVLNATLVTLKRSTSTLESDGIPPLRLNQLLSLHLLVPDSIILEDMIAMAIDASLPMGYDGRQLSFASGIRLGALSARSEMRWSCRLNQLPAQLDFYSFLTQESWTTSTVKILSGILYQQSFARRVFLRWLSSETCAQRSMLHLANVLCAFLDSSSAQGAEINDTESETLIPWFSRLCELVVDPLNSQELQSVCGTCIPLVISLCPSKKSDLIATLLKRVQQMPSVTFHILALGNQLHASIRADSDDIVDCLVDKGLRWTVRAFHEAEGELEKIVVMLMPLVRVASSVKAHLVDPIMTCVIQARLDDGVAVTFVSDLVQTTQLKPLIVNRHLQNILQHPQFFKLCSSDSRDIIICLVHTLFHLHPSNTCQQTHVEPLVYVYGGTASVADRKLLSILHLFEIQRKTSVASLINRWSPSPDLACSTALEALQNLDPIRVLRTCISFPKWRRLEDQAVEKKYTLGTEIYDPVFLILLFTRMLSDNTPAYAFSWVEIFRTNVVSLLIRCMSSNDGKIREIALCQIVGLWRSLEAADMHEKAHVRYILSLLKNLLPPPSDEAPIRLPSYISLISLHALRGIFYPSNFIYPLTARFLLQRPELDTNDVPMLYSMLYSSSENWKKERGWIIRFLSDDMMSTDDWRILKRRHTWDILSSLFQSSEKDRGLRRDILEVLSNITCNSQAAMSLVLRSGLLSWIEMQVSNANGEDGIAWVKILRNIIVVVDAAKVETSTNGQWRAVLCRCLTLLLATCEPSSAIPMFGLTVPAILLLSLLPGPSTPHLQSLVEQAMVSLRWLEDTIIPPAWTAESPSQNFSISPNGVQELHQISAYEPVRLWGDSVESLWRVTMTFGAKRSTWGMLTSRLLMWRSMVGEKSSAGEWARREAIRNLGL